MRLLHTFDDKKTADLFSSFLTQEGIENVCEITANTDWGSPDYGTVQCILWVVDENYYDTAQRWLDEFKANPNHPIFHAQKKFEPLSEILSNKSTSPPSPGAPKKPIDRKLPLTFFLLFTCIALFIWGGLTLPVTSNLVFKKLPPCELVFMPSIDKVLLFDYPQACDIEDRIIKIYGMDKLLNPATLPPEGKFLLAKAYQEPYWNGIYPMAIDYFRPPYTQWEFMAPLFEKIRQGEVWRLFTPCVLHGSIFHLLFNMLWLVYLGNIVEDNLRSVRYGVLVVLIGIISNTAQYLMSGPSFLGYSGVICGLVTFIWARQRCAPWEGYRLPKGLLGFLIFYILGLAGIQLLSFFIQIFQFSFVIPDLMANTAHLSGGVFGYLLGRLPLMAKKN